MGSKTKPIKHKRGTGFGPREAGCEKSVYGAPGYHSMDYAFFWRDVTCEECLAARPSAPDKLLLRRKKLLQQIKKIDKELRRLKAEPTLPPLT